jgi:hypothetical protein
MGEAKRRRQATRRRGLAARMAPALDSSLNRVLASKTDPIVDAPPV